MQYYNHSSVQDVIIVVQYKKIILLRYGIVTGTPMTLEQVANELGITRERARQIDSTFRGRLRPHYRKKTLIDYLDE